MEAEREQIIFRAQPGPQERFLSSSADIVIYGGAAGGGKSAGLLLEATRNLRVDGFRALILRRTNVDIRNPGAIWDESKKFFAPLGGVPREQQLDWRFMEWGSSIKLSGIEHDQNVLQWQGSQIPLIEFDELTHFSEYVFFYMLSRNRSLCGVKPYVRATCNPDSSSWVRMFIDWWIDQESGLAIPERDGVLRWMVRYQNEIIWGDTKQEVYDMAIKRGMSENTIPKSVTFIASSIYDNKILMQQNPEYLSNLQALPRVEREQLLGGNWNISSNDGIFFKEWFRYYDPWELPEVVGWSWSLDTAVKEGEENDFSVMQLWAECATGFYLIKNIKIKLPYPKLKQMFENLFEDHPANEVLIEDKASGQQLIQDFKASTTYPVISMMPGKNMSKTKIERANFVSTLFEAGRVFFPREAEWLQDYTLELCGFPNGDHDDQVDATTQYLTRKITQGRIDMQEVAAAIATGGDILDIIDDKPDYNEKAKEPDQLDKIANRKNRRPIGTPSQDNPYSAFAV